MDALCFIAVGCRNDLDNLITWELQLWDVRGAASHQVAVEDTKNTLMRDDQKIVLFTFKLENDRFKPDCKIMV